MVKAVAVKGSRTSHGGSIVTASEKSFCREGAEIFFIARIGDLHSCPDHGSVPIVGPVSELRALIEGKPVALVGDKTACGATITTGCDQGSNLGASLPGN